MLLCVRPAVETLVAVSVYEAGVKGKKHIFWHTGLDIGIALSSMISMIYFLTSICLCGMCSRVCACACAVQDLGPGG